MVETGQSWRELVATLCPRAVFGPPAADAEIAEAERRLSIPIPDDLRTLLAESDGVMDEYGWEILWPLPRIVANNDDYRHNPAFASYMPIDVFLFFAESGDGQPFGYSISGTCEVQGHVFVWNQIEDSRTKVADSLAGWLKGWLEGSLTV